MNQYPILNTLVRHGNLIAVVLGLLPIALAAALDAEPVMLGAAIVALRLPTGAASRVCMDCHPA